MVSVNRPFLYPTLAEPTARLIARGIVEAHRAAVQDGVAVAPGLSTPRSLRIGLARLSAICLAEGVYDLGASIHQVMEAAGRPMSEWGVPAFAEAGFPHRDTILIESDLGCPTEECAALAGGAGIEASAIEEAQYRRFQTMLEKAPDRPATYAKVREFVVRNPLVRTADLLTFLRDPLVMPVVQATAAFWRRIPEGALVAGRAHRCAGCGGLLWPDGDRGSFPEGRCRIRQCRAETGGANRSEVLETPSDWQWASAGILTYWVGPGQDEIGLHDALTAVGRASLLYPMEDAADVGVDGAALGVDLKDWGSPELLGAKLSRGIGRLALFSRRVVAIPDRRTRGDPRYITKVRDACTADVEILPVSAILRELSR